MSPHPRSERGGLSASLKFLAPLCFSVGLLVTLRLLGPQYLDQRQLSEWLRPLGLLAPLVFILLLAIRPVTLLPGQFFCAVGGLVFGMARGTVYALLGSLLATGVIHLVASRLGRKPMRRLAGRRHTALRHAARRHGFLLGFLACINSVIPADVLLATASASGARFWPLALGALLGTAPGTMLTALFGSALGQGKTWMTVASVSGLLLSLGLGLALGRRLMRELLLEENPEDNPEDNPSEDEEHPGGPPRTASTSSVS